MSTNPNNLVPMKREWTDPPLPPRREALWIAEGKKCHWCGIPTRLIADNAWDQATTEHIIPRGRGGTSEESNLTSSCLRCNQRRNYEDIMGLKEGSMIGKYPVTNSTKNPTASGKPNIYRHIALTGDEKKAIIGKTPNSIGGKASENVLREQRDQALIEISSLRKEIESLKLTVSAQEKELKSLTVWKLIRKKLSDWLAP